LNRLLSAENATANLDTYRKLTREHAEIAPVVELYQRYREGEADIQAAQEMSADPAAREFAESEMRQTREQLAGIEEDLQKRLLPKDPNDDRNIFLEVRAGTGGEESALFAGELFRLYSRYAERNRWQVEVVSQSPSDLGGFKEIIAKISGQGAYSKLKFESGGHRVQRVPATEASGRIHTSTATVAVLPEAEEVDISIDPNDVRVDVYRSTGPGGQSVNTTDSAVRLTHIPSGIVVSMQDEKSQLQNKDKAWRVLRSRLLQMEREKAAAELAGVRKSQVGTGGRSEKIRTYNYKDNRVTDHRIGLTVKRLDSILEGDLDEFVEALTAADQAEKLAEGTGT